jgi:hypothetical protein
MVLSRWYLEETENTRCKCVGQILKYWYWILSLDIEDPAKQYNEWQKSNKSVTNWTSGLKGNSICLVQEATRV